MSNETPKTQTRKPKYRIELVEKTFSILDAFQPEHRELTVREIVEETGQTQSGVYRILANLTRLRVLEQDPATRKYRVGSKLYALGCLEVSDVRKLAMPHMEQLRSEFQFTVSLSAAHDRWGGTLVEVLESHEPYALSFAVGTREPLHSTASGKCALAYATPEEREALLAETDLSRFTANTLTDRQSLDRALAEIREQGYALDRGEWAQHVTCVAAPLFDRTESYCGAITLSVPANSRKADTLPTAIPVLTEATRQVSLGLGYTGHYPPAAA